MWDLSSVRWRKATVRLLAGVIFLFGTLLLVPVHSKAEGQPPSVPEVSQGVEADTRKALEEMEEALMDQIQREDMQAAEMAASSGDKGSGDEKVPAPDVESVLKTTGTAEPDGSSAQNSPAPQAVSSRKPAGRQTGKTAPPMPAPALVPQQEHTTKTPVYIRDSGVDQAGLRLGFFARETFSASSQFTLSNRNERKIVIRIDSRPEFPARPALSSIYAATWILVEDEATVPYYLATQVGVVSPDSAPMEADRIVSRTARILEQFAYLFE